MIDIRQFEERDWQAVWGIVEPVFRSGETYAVRLWIRHGFDVIGTLPKAFLHSRLGYVDALVMYKQLHCAE